MIFNGLGCGPMNLGCGGLGAAMPGDSYGNGYMCQAGNCWGTTPSAVSLFKILQTEINRVRKVYGLTADIPIDGVIGPLTAARLIRLARTISSKVSHVDPAIDTYAIETVNLPGPDQVAADAAALVAALRRNGYDAMHAPTSTKVDALINPYQTTKPVVVTVGPTSPGGGSASPPAPTAPVKWTPGKTAAVGIGAAVLGALGVGIAAFAKG